MNRSEATFPARQPGDQAESPRFVRKPLLSHIRIDHGPVDVLARFFIAADALLQEEGVELAFGSFEELEHVNGCNRDNWRPLNPTFVPANGLLTEESAFVLLGSDRSGRVVTATALKVFNWQETDFRREAESLRLLFADPDGMAPAGAACSVATPSAESLRGCIGYAGAGWLHPSVRKRRIGAVLSRILRAWAYARWRVDSVCAISSLGLIAKGYTEQNGYRHTEAGVRFFGLEACPPEAGVVWITSDELIDDLQSWIRPAAGDFGRAQDAPLAANFERQHQPRIVQGGSTS